MIAFTRSLIATGLLRQRQLHTSVIALSAEKSPLYKLRQKTGLAYSLCREALNKHDNNVDEAEAWLKAHALAHGLQKATKVGNRATREGLICLSVSRDNSLTTMVELNCETDFVARNQLFKDFLIDVTEQIASNHKESTSYKLPAQDLIGGLKPSDTQIKKVEEQIAPLISKLGENIKLSRALHLQPTHNMDTTRIFGQIHSQSAKKTTDHFDIMAGRFGSIVALRLLGESKDLEDTSLKAIGNRLCRHVIGYSPSYIELPDDIRKHLEEAEQKKSELKRDQADAGNEADDGEFSDNESSQGTQNSRDDWPSIMDQTLIMTDDLIVRDFCKMNNISIEYFDRFECGIEP